MCLRKFIGNKSDVNNIILGEARINFTLKKDYKCQTFQTLREKRDKELVPHVQSSLSNSAHKSLFLSQIPTCTRVIPSVGYLLPG